MMGLSMKILSGLTTQFFHYVYGTHFFKQPDPPFELGKFALLISLVWFLHDLDHLQTPYSQYSDIVSPLFNVKKNKKIFLGPYGPPQPRVRPKIGKLVIFRPLLNSQKEVFESFAGLWTSTKCATIIALKKVRGVLKRSFRWLLKGVQQKTPEFLFDCVIKT